MNVRGYEREREKGREGKAEGDGKLGWHTLLVAGWGEGDRLSVFTSGTFSLGLDSGSEVSVFSPLLHSRTG